MGLRTIIRIPAAVGIVALAALGYVKSEQGDKDIAVANNLSRDESLAFRACRHQMYGKSMTITQTAGKVTFSTVPAEICVCQSRTMAKLFEEDSYASHASVIEYVSGDGPATDINPAKIRNGADARTAFRTLAASLGKCRDDYALTYGRQQAEALSRHRQQRN